MTIIHSSDLGWTAGQDISDEFAVLALTFKPGDTFVFDHMYEITGSNIQLPDNFTLAGGVPGAGIDVTDTASNSNPLLLLGNVNTLVDLTVTHSNAPTVAPTRLRTTEGVEYHSKRTIVSQDKDDITILNSHFEGNVGIILDIFKGNNLLVEDCEFNGGLYQIRLLSEVTNPVIHNSLFQNSVGDGIKTVVGSDSQHTVNATVSESVFLNNNRDGIDTTGGFRDSVITDSYFINGFSGLDIKEVYGSSDDFAFGAPINQNILITNSEFIDNNNAIVVTTTDRGDPPYLNPDNAEQWAAQNIRLEDSIVENTDTGSLNSIFLVKDSFDIHWSNIATYGNIQGASLTTNFNTGLPKDVSGTITSTNPVREQQPDSYYQSLAGPDWSNITYPADGTVTPVDPVVDPDPISYIPPETTDQTTDPAPVVEAPVPSNSGPVAESDVANTDHNKTILVDVLGNDSDPDGDALTLTKVSYSGTTSIVTIENGKIKVNPLSAATEDRVETITYTVSDGKGGTDTAELKVNIGPVEVSASQPDSEAPAEPEPIVTAPVESAPVVEAPVPSNSGPVAESDVANTDHNKTILVDVLGNDSDPDGDALTLTKVSYSGTTSIVTIENGKIKVNPLSAATEDRVETITYTVSDGKGGTDTAELKVNIGPVEVSASQPDSEAPAEPEPVAEAPAEPEPVEVIAAETDLAPDLISQGPYSQFLDIKLIDTGTDNVLVDLNQGAKLSSSDMSGRKITLSAEAINSSNVDIGSVKLEMDGQYSRIENVEPYALFGDRNGDFLGGEQLTDGTHFATLTVYSGKNGKGSILEQFTVDFEVGDYDSLIIDGSRSTISSYSAIQDTGTATVSEDQSAVELKGSAWKSLNLFGSITEQTVLEFDFKSDVEGEIQGIGFINSEGNLETTFFQLDGSQDLGIQDFNDAYETGSGFKSYTIPVGEYFTGSVEQLVLVSDDDADFGAMSMFSNIGLIEGIA